MNHSDISQLLDENVELRVRNRRQERTIVRLRQQILDAGLTVTYDDYEFDPSEEARRRAAETYEQAMRGCRGWMDGQ